MDLLPNRARRRFAFVFMSSSLRPAPVRAFPLGRSPPRCIAAAPLPPAGRQPENGRENGTPLFQHSLWGYTTTAQASESVGESSWVCQERQERASLILTMLEINWGTVLSISKGLFIKAHDWAHLGSVLQSEYCRSSWSSYVSPDGEKILVEVFSRVCHDAVCRFSPTKIICWIQGL